MMSLILKNSLKQHTWAVLLLTLLPIGCATRTPPVQVGQVHGNVTFEGQPVQAATITFEDRTQGQLASAELKADGSYEVVTSEGGLRVGSYAVWLVPKANQAPSITDLNAAKTPDPKDIPKKYRNATTSELTLKVQPGDNSFDITMAK